MSHSEMQNYELLIPYMRELLDHATWHQMISGSSEYTPPMPAYKRPINGKNMRFDVEIDKNDSLPNKLSMKARRLIKDQLALDLADLAVNGDTASTDPYLKTFDGEAKLGKRFSKIEISPVVWYQQYSSMKDTWEYTLYAVVGYSFEDPE